MKRTHMLDNTSRVVEQARKKGATIMHAPITFVEGYNEISAHPHDTFASTNLDFILRNKGIETVVLGGFLTNCCVESTMRSAYERGFEVITLTDCLAATSPEAHDNAIQHDYPMFSKPMSSTEFIGQLG